jgi:hypothetical protein
MRTTADKKIGLDRCTGGGLGCGGDHTGFGRNGCDAADCRGDVPLAADAVAIEPTPSLIASFLAQRRPNVP